ncbi:hypothetical protein K0U07_02340 [bacterium]|nr:hypothetical protein [bacterium]
MRIGDVYRLEGTKHLVAQDTAKVGSLLAFQEKGVWRVGVVTYISGGSFDFSINQGKKDATHIAKFNNVVCCFIRPDLISTWNSARKHWRIVKDVRGNKLKERLAAIITRFSGYQGTRRNRPVSLCFRHFLRKL